MSPRQRAGRQLGQPCCMQAQVNKQQRCARRQESAPAHCICELPKAAHLAVLKQDEDSTVGCAIAGPSPPQAKQHEVY